MSEKDPFAFDEDEQKDLTPIDGEGHYVEEGAVNESGFEDNDQSSKTDDADYSESEFEGDSSSDDQSDESVGYEDEQASDEGEQEEYVEDGVEYEEVQAPQMTEQEKRAAENKKAMKKYLGIVGGVFAIAISAGIASMVLSPDAEDYMAEPVRTLDPQQLAAMNGGVAPQANPAPVQQAPQMPLGGTPQVVDPLSGMPTGQPQLPPEVADLMGGVQMPSQPMQSIDGMSPSNMQAMMEGQATDMNSMAGLQNPAGMEAAPPTLTAEQRKIEELMSDNRMMADEIRSLQSKIAEKGASDPEVLAKLESLEKKNKALSSENARLKSAYKKEMARSSKSTSAKSGGVVPVSEVAVYRVKAIVPGIAWIQSSESGQVLEVRDGETLPGDYRIEKIDADRYLVMTNRGVVK